MTYSAIFTCCLLMYSLIDKSPVTSSSASTKAHYHSLPSPLFFSTPRIRLAILWWKLYMTVIVKSVTTQISLPYSRNTCITTLYIITQDSINCYTGRMCVTGLWRGSLGASFVSTDSWLRIFWLSVVVDRPSDRLYVHTIPLYGCMDIRYRYIPFSSQAWMSIW